jgi:hypothetical protein
VRISPEIDRHCEANVFSLAEGSIWPRPLWRGRAGSPGSLAQGRLHRDDPGTEESSPISSQTERNASHCREVRALEGRPERARRDVGAVLQPHTTDEGGEPQGFRKGAATGATGGKGEASERIC